MIHVYVDSKCALLRVTRGSVQVSASDSTVLLYYDRWRDLI
jgi:hypothetical protein